MFLSPQPNKGFTLIEMLVVIFIVGIMAGLVTLSIRHDRISGQVQAEQHLLTELFTLGQQEAMIRSRSIGVFVRRQGLRFGILQDETWNMLPASGPFRERHLKQDYIYRLLLADNKLARVLDIYTDEPQIIFYPSGESTSFSLFLEKLNGEQQWLMEGDIYGDFSSSDDSHS